MFETRRIKSLHDGEWRKRAGVEPTKDRLTALPGFEVRTSHQRRFSSKLASSRLSSTGTRRNVDPKMIEPLPVQDTKISTTNCHAMTIEEFQKLD
jgi:hypothetical protein